MPADNNSEDNNTAGESDIEITVEEETHNNDVNKSYIISDADVLHKFVQTTLELREIVKCPLCLDVMAKPVEISCSHCFCEKCLETFFEEFDKPVCPVCRSAINKRSRKANESLLGYIRFVNDVNKELQNCFDSEVIELSKRAKINEKLGLPNVSSPRKRAISASSISDVIPATVQTPKKRGRPPKSKQQSSNKKQVAKTIKTPSVSHQKNKTNGSSDSIIHWLTDNKNKFDRITQTQQSASSRCSQESFDMPSVSQLKNKNRSIFVPRRVRSASLSNENALTYQEPRVRHNSWPSGNGKLDNFLTSGECLLVFLEETRKNAELRQKEEEFLESIENEMEMQKKIEQPQQVNKKRKGKSGTNKKVEKKISPLVASENKNVLVQQKNCDLEVVQAHFNKNLSKITNNGVDFRVSPPKCEKATKRAVVVLERHDFAKDSSKVQTKGDTDYKKPSENFVVDLEQSSSKKTSAKHQNKLDKAYKKSSETNVAVLEKDSAIKTLQKIQTKLDAEYKKPDESTVVDLEQNSSTKISPRIQNKVDKEYKQLAGKTVLVLNEKKSKETVQNNSDDDDYIFLLPTQKIPSQQNQQTDTENLFIALQNCIEKIQLLSSDDAVAENCRLLKHCAANIQEFFKDEKRSKSPTLSDVYFSQNLKTNTTNAETQTDELILKDAAVQADEEQNEPPTPSSTVLSEPFNGFLISKLVEKYGKEPNTKGELKKASQKSSSFEKITFKTKDLLLENSQKSDEVANKISNTLDNIDFDTQQLLQKHKNNKLLSDSGSKSVLNVSGRRNLVSRRLDYSENLGESQRKKFKRIRAPSDSDSDSEIQDRKRNKYLQEDISVQFESEVPVATRSSEEEFKLSDDASYSVFVDKILKKYDEPPASTQFEKVTSSKPSEKSTANKSTDVIERCERIIKQVDRNTVTALQINQHLDENRNTNSCKTQKHVFSSEETFNDEEVLQAIDRDIEEIRRLNVHIKKQDSFCESQILSKQIVNGNKTKNLDAVIELDDSFDEEIALLEPENEDVTVVANKRKEINILHDVAIKPVEMQEEIGASDEEIFSDIDVVENTPPRTESQFDEPIDVILPPPPEFQEEITSKHQTTLTPAHEFNTELDVVDKTLTEHMKTACATPDFLSPPLPAARSQPINALGTSTPISGKTLSEKSLNFSPIALQRTKNPFEAAKNIKQSSLTVMENAPSVGASRKPAEAPPPKQQQSILNYVKPVAQEMVVITCSRLESEHMLEVSALANRKLAVYTSAFGAQVTHVVVAVNEKNCVRDHTMKYVCGVAAGIWVVSARWVQKCLAVNRIVAEEPYEVKDVSGVDGPRQSRLARTKNPLLRGFKIYAAPPFLSTTPADVENVIKMLGGTVVPKPEALSNKQGHICVIVSEASATQDFEIYESWLETYKVITVDIEWLSRSVGQYKIVSLKPFALCSEDLLDNLGYPDDMIGSLQSSASENT